MVVPRANLNNSPVLGSVAGRMTAANAQGVAVRETLVENPPPGVSLIAGLDPDSEGYLRRIDRIIVRHANVAVGNSKCGASAAMAVCQPLNAKRPSIIPVTAQVGDFST